MNEIIETRAARRALAAVAVAVGVAVGVAGLAGASYTSRLVRAATGPARVTARVVEKKDAAVGRAERIVFNVTKHAYRGEATPGLTRAGGPAREDSTFRSVERIGGWVGYHGKCGVARCNPRIARSILNAATRAVGDLTPVR